MSDEEAATPADLVSLQVDDQRCIGSGMCEMLAEQVFVIDDDTNVATVVGEAALPSDKAAEVIDRCPAGAITMVDGDE